jgi:diphosphomevalonate decarboxylase
MLSLIQHFFPMDLTMDSQEYLGRSAEFLPSAVDKETLEIISSLKCRVQPPGALKKIMSTGIGSGPRDLARGYDASVSLLNEQGYPIAA